VAHSINAGLNGVGGIAYPDPSRPQHRTCYEASHFSAYKCAKQGLFGWFETKKAVFTDITSVDNAWGIALAVKQSGEGEYNEFWSEIANSKVYGEFLESKDCPEDGSFCKRLAKMGVMAALSEIG